MDGSSGTHGTVLDAAPDLREYPTVYACGPNAMLAAVKDAAGPEGLRQLSVEERMGCGNGSCNGCVVPVDGGYVRSCVEGRSSGRRSGVVVRDRATGVDLSVELCGMTLSTPLVPASGTLAKEALGEVGGVYGAILPKTTTPAARKGNPPPRVAETPAGMVNSIGLQNPGVERFMEDLDVFDLGVPIFVSVAGETVRDFAALCERVSEDARVAAVELNLSCPNVEHGGLTFCAGPAAVGRSWPPAATRRQRSRCSPSSPTRG
jgi:hypothetical protein